MSMFVHTYVYLYISIVRILKQQHQLSLTSINFYCGYNFHFIYNRTHSSRVGPYDDDVGYVRIARSHFIKYLCMGAFAIPF